MTPSRSRWKTPPGMWWVAMASSMIWSIAARAAASNALPGCWVFGLPGGWGFGLLGCLVAWLLGCDVGPSLAGLAGKAAMATRVVAKRSARSARRIGTRV